MKFLLLLAFCVAVIHGSYFIGNNVGYKNGARDAFSIMKSNSPLARRFVEAINTYGNLHNTPWGFLTIEEKMYLCAYGSSGNKLSRQDMEEIKNKYQVVE